MSTQKLTSPSGDIDQARKLFERHLLVKGLDFLWDGRKYNTTNISTSGSMLINVDCKSPPAAAAGADWAKAEEMNTGKLHK